MLSLWWKMNNKPNFKWNFPWSQRSRICSLIPLLFSWNHEGINFGCSLVRVYQIEKRTSALLNIPVQFTCNNKKMHHPKSHSESIKILCRTGSWWVDRYWEMKLFWLGKKDENPIQRGLTKFVYQVLKIFGRSSLREDHSWVWRGTTCKFECSFDKLYWSNDRTGLRRKHTSSPATESWQLGIQWRWFLRTTTMPNPGHYSGNNFRTVTLGENERQTRPESKTGSTRQSFP